MPKNGDMGNPGFGLEWSEDGRGVIDMPPVSKKWVRNQSDSGSLVGTSYLFETTCRLRYTSHCQPPHDTTAMPLSSAAHQLHKIHVQCLNKDWKLVGQVKTLLLLASLLEMYSKFVLPNSLAHDQSENDLYYYFELHMHTILIM